MKKPKLEKNFYHTDNRKADKITRKDHRDYLEYFHQHGHKCIVCGNKIIEAHHESAQDNTTLVPLCPYHHRGFGDVPKGQKGFYLHRGTRSAEFNEAYPPEYRKQIARELYLRYLGEAK